ncbi:MAG: hypothetical protein ACR5K5_05565, partial [Wolbachia sp.]
MAEQLALLHNLFSDSNFTLKFANEKTSLTNSASPLIMVLEVFIYLQSVQIKRQQHYVIGVLFLI